MRYDVTLVTYDAFPNLYADDLLLRDALERRGARVRPGVWDDPAVDWSASERTVFRSNWNYFEKPDAFRAWLDHAQSRTTLVNSAPIVRWNMDKFYLADLERRGFSCVPTAYVRAGERASVERIAAARGWGDIVVKPCISGASFGTKRFRAGDPAAQAHAEDLLAQQRDLIVQPFLPAIETHGEIALMFVGTQYSHAARKLPFNDIPWDGIDHEVLVEPTADEIALASRIIASLDELPLYARVDFVPSLNGPLVMELELIEPSFYFRLHPASADRLAAHLLSP